MAKEFHTSNRQKGRSGGGGEDAKTDTFPQRRKVPGENTPKGQRPVSPISNISKEGSLGTFQTRTNQLLH